MHIHDNKDEHFIVLEGTLGIGNRRKLTEEGALHFAGLAARYAINTLACSFQSTHTCCGTRPATRLANDGQDTRALQHYLGDKNVMNTVRFGTIYAAERIVNQWSVIWG
jgi:integrase